jgi:hypothetical protein
MKDLSDWKTNSMQKHIPNMSRDGSQTKRKRDATTGSTVKAHLDWRDKYLDKFHTTPHKGIEEFIDNLLSTVSKKTRLDWEGLLKEIIEHNKDDMTGLYDFDGIALEVISLVKK